MKGEVSEDIHEIRDDDDIIGEVSSFFFLCNFCYLKNRLQSLSSFAIRRNFLSISIIKCYQDFCYVTRNGLLIIHQAITFHFKLIWSDF